MKPEQNVFEKENEEVNVEATETIRPFGKLIVSHKSFLDTGGKGISGSIEVLNDELVCHSRENGNPGPKNRKPWVPAFAGMTPLERFLPDTIFQKPNPA